jgi:lysyl-tRNA synthetase class 2
VTHWRPSSAPEVARQRAAILRRTRQYFDSEQVLEVDTPALSHAAVSDVHIESLEVSSCLTNTALYLHTSPEFCMKKLLAAGYPDIYSICRVFRDAEIGRQHQPEFTMVEWYRLGFQLKDIIADTLNAIATSLDDPRLADDAATFDYRDVFVTATGIDPLTASIAALGIAADADDSLISSLGNERDDWLDLILTTKVIPTFSTRGLTVVQHYPASQAALARICPGSPAVADRFEVFLGSIELANGYVELTDAQTQSMRIENDQSVRKRRGQLLRPHDESLIAALQEGLPVCAGVAMGLERLHMLHNKTDDIGDVITFKFEAHDE